MNRKDILVFSNEPWGEVWFSKQHYANELSKIGHQVYFFNPPMKWKPSHLFKWNWGEEIIGPKLSAINYWNPIPGGNAFSRWINDLFLCLKLKLWLPKADPIFWNFDPFRLGNLFFFRKSKYVYHVVDKYLFRSDLKCANQADLIPIVSKEYIGRYSKWKDKLVHTPHGLPEGEFQPSEAEVNELRNRFGKYFLFVGTFHDGVDIGLLMEISEKFQDVKLVLVGPVGNGISVPELEKLRKQPNVELVGSVPSSKIKNYIAASIACLIPYKMEQAYRTQTLKSLHYLAQGKPIVSIPLKDWEFLEGKFLFFADNHDDYLNQLNNVITKKAENSNELNEYLSSVRYEHLIEAIFKQLEKA